MEVVCIISTKNIKKVVILGSTGSIGKQSLEVIKQVGYEVLGLAVKKSIDLLKRQVFEFKPKVVAVFDEERAEILKHDPDILSLKIEVLSGKSGLLEVSILDDADIILNALTGMVGLEPTLAALSRGKTVAIANKETLVAGGGLVTRTAHRNNATILPVDSEHSAIFQCMNFENPKRINRLILTASGGPFFGKTKEFLEKVTVEDALNHPTWTMGPKNTVDSATLVNKGLELIEAANLFNIPPQKIEIIVHRESVIHSMVEFCDGAVLAQMSTPNMRLPIEFALTYPERTTQIVESLDFKKIKNLSFDAPDFETFGGLKVCVKAAEIGGIMPIVVNSANEELVSAFLDRKIRFCEIAKILEKVYNAFALCKLNHEKLEDILHVDKISREFTRGLISKKE